MTELNHSVWPGGISLRQEVHFHPTSLPIFCHINLSARKITTLSIWICFVTQGIYRGSEGTKERCRLGQKNFSLERCLKII